VNYNWHWKFCSNRAGRNGKPISITDRRLGWTLATALAAWVIALRSARW